MNREAERLKLRLYSGETSADEVPPIDIPSASTVNESTPLLGAAAYIVPKKHTWRTRLLAILGAIEFVGRVFVLVTAITQVIQGQTRLDYLVSPIIFSVGWIYATLKLIAFPGLTVPYGVLSVYIISLFSTVGALYTTVLNSDDGANGTTTYFALHIASGVISLFGIGIIMGMPLELNGEPTIDEDQLLPAKDDFVTLYGWLSFNWMTDFVKIGAQRAVEESDVWQLSYLLRARVLMTKFRHFRRGSLIRRLLAANALDLTCDCVLTVSASLS